MLSRWDSLLLKVLNLNCLLLIESFDYVAMPLIATQLLLQPLVIFFELLTSPVKTNELVQNRYVLSE